MRVSGFLAGLSVLLFSCVHGEEGMNLNDREESLGRHMNIDAGMLEKGRQFRSRSWDKAPAFEYIEGLILEEYYSAALKILNERAVTWHSDEDFQALYTKTIQEGGVALDPAAIRPDCMNITGNSPALYALLNRIRIIDSLTGRIKGAGAFPETHLLRGLAYLELNKLDAAGFDFNVAFRTDTTLYNPFYYIIYTFYLQGNHRDALQFLNRHISHIDFINEAGRQTAGRLSTVLNDLDKIDKKGNLDQKEKHLKKAELYVKLKDYQLAVRDLDTALTLDNQFGDAYALRALVHHNLKLRDNALEDLEKAEKITGNYNSPLSKIIKNQE